MGAEGRGGARPASRGWSRAAVSGADSETPPGETPGGLRAGRPRATAYEARLPQGAGRALVVAACVQCHDLGVTVNQHKSLAEWRQSVDIMVRLGAKLTGSETQVVARYLARSFGQGQ